ncbi:VWA domain-containing protein [Streptomyces sp. WMMC500]|uniref:VWA domain-containing protein n=1 Tax=Streptomyces sp. WMMC500 TaxID=3015154 RepID=UPI00248B9B46|nr:VWA domain-containing protein [Streptomyces sp. WMMC500]WBB61901.1 VWA domain-containing protein [Streptomyces sp. WMMC500]
MSGHERAVLDAWLAGGRFGLLLVGDSVSRAEVWRTLRGEVDRPVTFGPGTDLAALHVTPDPWASLHGDGPPPGLLTRAAGSALLLPAADLLDSPRAAAVADAPRLLAQAPSLTDVPTALSDRLTAVIDADTVAAAGGGRGARDAAPPAAGDVVALLHGHGLTCHHLDVGATRLAVSLAVAGYPDPLGAVEAAVCTPRSGTPPRPRSTPPDASPPEPRDDSGPAEQTPPGDQDGTAEGTGTAEDASTGDDGRATSRGRTGAADSGERADGGPDGTGGGGPDGRDGGGTQPAEPPAAGPPARTPEALPGRFRTTRGVLDGRHGAPGEHPLRGRPRRTVPVARAAGRPAILPTLAAAAPWQRARGAAGGIVLRPEDLRGRLRVRHGGRLVVIVVDASGSMARSAIRTAKALALAALDTAYRDRSTVTVVVARGPRAVVGLPPTRSTARARTALRALPTGGGTPLASALLLAAETARRHDPSQVEALVLTDGRANVPLRPGGDPRADAERAARRLAAACSRVVVGDPAHRFTRPRPRAGWLEAALAVEAPVRTGH